MSDKAITLGSKVTLLIISQVRKRRPRTKEFSNSLNLFAWTFFLVRRTKLYLDKDSFRRKNTCFFFFYLICERSFRRKRIWANRLSLLEEKAVMFDYRSEISRCDKNRFVRQRYFENIHWVLYFYFSLSSSDETKLIDDNANL